MLEREGCKALQYSTTEGHPGLREQIVRRMNRDLGTAYAASQILVTSGSQQGLDLTGKLFLDEGDEVLCESPTYIGAINAFRAYQPRFVEVPTDDDGMIPEELERCIAGCRRPKFIYVIPDLPEPDRAHLDAWSGAAARARGGGAARPGRGRGRPVRAALLRGRPRRRRWRSMAKDVPVVYLGTFSKIFCPGMRIGWLAAPPELYEKYVLAKQGLDLNTSTLGQYQLLAYLERFDLDAGIARIRDVYRRRRDAMLRAIETEFPAGVSLDAARAAGCSCG